MPLLDSAVRSLDPASAARVRPALAWLGQRRGAAEPEATDVREYLWHELPAAAGGAATGSREYHEVAWALGDLFERAGLPGLAEVCRAPSTHEVLAAWRWAESFVDVPPEFWRPGLTAVGLLPAVPPRVGLSLAAAQGLLHAVGDGLPITRDGHLPPATVARLDDRFRWTEEFPWIRSRAEPDVPPLHFLHEHLTAQRLLERDGARVRVSDAGRVALDDEEVLWRAVVDPGPRWMRDFDRDVLGVMACSLLRAPTFAPGRVAEELTRVLFGKWRPPGRGAVFDSASLVVQAWYQVGVPLGWWDSGRGPADRRPNEFCRVAAAAVLRSVAARPLS